MKISHVTEKKDKKSSTILDVYFIKFVIILFINLYLHSA